MKLTYEEMQARDLARTEETRRLFAAIAVLMMPDWTVNREDQPGHDFILERGGLAFHLRRGDGAQSDKVHVSTWTWPRYNTRQSETQVITPSSVSEPSPSISCSISRGAEAIVRDIRKRFLPEYERIHAKCAEKARAWGESEARAEAAWSAVCKVIGKSPDRGSHYFGRLSLTSRSDGAKVELDVNASQLAVLIQALGIKDKEKGY